jgi:hypothetical protein
MGKHDLHATQFYTAKVQQLSAMGGFPLSRKAAEQAVKRAEARPTPNLAVLKKKIAGRLASGPSYRIAR